MHAFAVCAHLRLSCVSGVEYEVDLKERDASMAANFDYQVGTRVEIDVGLLRKRWNLLEIEVGLIQK